MNANANSNAAERPTTAPGVSSTPVTGATGFVGRALVAALSREDRPVIALSRDVRSARTTHGERVRVCSRDSMD